jgi:hypothetical protein
MPGAAQPRLRDTVRLAAPARAQVPDIPAPGAARHGPPQDRPLALREPRRQGPERGASRWPGSLRGLRARSPAAEQRQAAAGAQQEPKGRARAGLRRRHDRHQEAQRLRVEPAEGLDGHEARLQGRLARMAAQPLHRYGQRRCVLLTWVVGAAAGGGGGGERARERGRNKRAPDVIAADRFAEGVALAGPKVLLGPRPNVFAAAARPLQRGLRLLLERARHGPSDGARGDAPAGPDGARPTRNQPDDPQSRRVHGALRQGASAARQQGPRREGDALSRLRQGSALQGGRVSQG